MGRDLVTTKPIPRNLVKEIAMDVGKDVVSHLKFVYPDIMNNAPSTFAVTIRNGIYNRIMMHADLAEKGQTESQLKAGAEHRRVMSKYAKRKQPR